MRENHAPQAMWVALPSSFSRNYPISASSCSVISDSLQPHGLHAAHQASLSFTTSQSLFKLMSIESVMPFSHLVLCRPLLLLPSIFSSIRAFSSELAFHFRWPNVGVSASAPVLPMMLWRTVISC